MGNSGKTTLYFADTLLVPPQAGCHLQAKSLDQVAVRTRRPRHSRWLLCGGNELRNVRFERENHRLPRASVDTAFSCFKASIRLRRAAVNTGQVLRPRLFTSALSSRRDDSRSRPGANLDKLRRKNFFALSHDVFYIRDLIVIYSGNYRWTSIHSCFPAPSPSPLTSRPPPPTPTNPFRVVSKV